MQAAKTYLERHFETFGGASLDELIRHALQALGAALQASQSSRRPARRAGATLIPLPLLAFWLHPAFMCCTLPPHFILSNLTPPCLRVLHPFFGSSSLQDGELTSKNCSIAVVGAGLPFTLLEDDLLEPHIAGGGPLGGVPGCP